MSKAIDPERSEAERTLWHTLDEAGWSADQIEEHFAAYRNAYAHELAERVRGVLSEDGPGAKWDWWDAATIPARCANLIDPEVSG